MSTRRSAQVAVSNLLTTFLRDHFKEDERNTVALTLTELDAPFHAWFDRHRAEHALTCAACRDGLTCLTRNALSELTPHPITGISDRLHAYLLAHANFDLASGTGTLQLDSLALTAASR